MNDEFDNKNFSAPNGEPNKQPEQSQQSEQSGQPGYSASQAPSWGKPEQPGDPWQQPQSQVNTEQNPNPSYYGAQQYGGGYQNYNAPRQSGPAHGKKKNKTGMIIGIIAAVLGSVMIGAAIMGAVLYPMFKTYQQSPGGSYSQSPLPSAPEASGGTQEGGDPNADIGGTAPVITDYVNPIPEIADNSLKSVVGVTTMKQGPGGQAQASSRGTGFVISSSGYIMTNYHVISGGSKFIVTDHDGTEYDATLIGGDENLDVAVLKIDANLPALAIGDSDSTRVGEMVVAIGDPAGAGQNLTGTVTVGYVSAMNRELMFNNMRQKFIQMDAAINPGNSGGPLFNSKGEVIGVVTLKSLISSTDANGTTINTEGIGFAIPINSAIDAARQIISSGSVQRPGIGIRYSEITAQTAEANNLVPGNMVATFMGGSTAKEAGLEVGDIIIRCEGQDITQVNMSDLIAAKEIGDSVTVTVWRNGQELDFTIKIGDVNKMTDEG